MARRLALSHHARGFCHKQDVIHLPRSPLQLIAALEDHTSAPGKEVLAGLKDLVCLEREMWRKEKEMWEKEMCREKEMWEKEKEMWKDLSLERMDKEKILREVIDHLKDRRCEDLYKILSLKGLNNTRGLFEQMEEVLAAHTTNPGMRGFPLWEAILNTNKDLRQCIENCTKVKDVLKQAAHCHTIYNVLSQHIHAGKELAGLQRGNKKILFNRGPLSPEQVQIFLCIGQAAKVDIDEDPVTRPC